MMTFLIGIVIGVGLGVGAVLMNCKVQSMESWEEEQARSNGNRRCFHLLIAENAKLRVALAAGEMTEDGKKVAGALLAALDGVIANASTAIIGVEPEKPGENESEPDDCVEIIP
jgi:hypothetical protein